MEELKRIFDDYGRILYDSLNEVGMDAQTIKKIVMDCVARRYESVTQKIVTEKKLRFLDQLYDVGWQNQAETDETCSKALVHEQFHEVVEQFNHEMQQLKHILYEQIHGIAVSHGVTSEELSQEQLQQCVMEIRHIFDQAPSFSEIKDREEMARAEQLALHAAMQRADAAAPPATDAAPHVPPSDAQEGSAPPPQAEAVAPEAPEAESVIPQTALAEAPDVATEAPQMTTMPEAVQAAKPVSDQPPDAKSEEEPADPAQPQWEELSVSQPARRRVMPWWAVLLCVVGGVAVLWLVLGFLLAFGVLNGFDLGYAWFNSNVFPLF